MTADPAILESRLGFLSAVVMPEDRDLAAVTERLGRPFVLEGPLRIKRYPACSPGHPLIEAALRLVHEHGVRPGDIHEIAADLHTFSLLRRAPRDAESAGFSGAFLIAATLVHGRFTLEELTEEVVHDPRVQALMSRIRHRPAGPSEMISVVLAGSRTVQVEVRPAGRLSAGADVRAKFRQCAAPLVPSSAIERLEAMILNLDRQPDITHLMAAASPAPADAPHEQAP
jgi:2-methylcitrate dehydratase PrpD